MSLIALQTFTIRKDLKKIKTIPFAFEKLKKKGVNSVELARIKFAEKEIKAIAKACKGLDMKVKSTQITFDFLQKNVDLLTDLHRELNCTTSCVSVLPTKYILNAAKIVEFPEQLNALGAAYREKGIRLLFHHHHFEFRKYKNRLLIDYIMDGTRPENIGLVCDTYWTQRGGKNPAGFIRKPENRVEAIHLRDYAIKWQYMDLLPTDKELGEGNLNFKEIINAGLERKVQYMAIEQNSRNPYVSVSKSVQHIKDLGFSELF